MNMDEQKQDYQKYLIIGVIILVLLLIFYWYAGAEHLGNPFFLDQMAMEYSDPTWLNYLGYERDVSGQSPRDYYLENQMNSETGVGPQYFEGDLQFKDHTGYMDMPIKYRPLRRTSASAAQMQSELVSNNLEEYAYQDLNHGGFY